MKSFLLSALALFYFSTSHAQVNSLPFGRYETFVKDHQSRWDQGDIILLDNNRYRVSTSEEVGEYKLSVTTQRILFVTGPLKTVFAKLSADSNTPTIVIPREENEQKGIKIVHNDVLGYYRQ
jgi:hypothetical protein